MNFEKDHQFPEPRNATLWMTIHLCKMALNTFD